MLLSLLRVALNRLQIRARGGPSPAKKTPHVMKEGGRRRRERKEATIFVENFSNLLNLIFFC